MGVCIWLVGLGLFHSVWTVSTGFDGLHWNLGGRSETKYAAVEQCSGVEQCGVVVGTSGLWS